MLKKIKLEDLVPFDKNPRLNDQAVDRVLESLKFNGYVSPIVVNEIGHPFEQHVIAAGHTRWKALQKFGTVEADVFVYKFGSEKHFVRYNIEDNKSGEFAEWDEQELANLESEFELELSEMGFDFDDESKDEDDDLSDDLDKKYEIAVECNDEPDQEKKYNKLIELGYKCRLLTL
jgi:ParB-like chromosome segregation protein Spo0J